MRPVIPVLPAPRTARGQVTRRPRGDEPLGDGGRSRRPRSCRGQKLVPSSGRDPPPLPGRGSGRWKRTEEDFLRPLVQLKIKILLEHEIWSVLAALWCWGNVCQIRGSTERRTRDTISVNSRIKIQRNKRGNVFLNHGIVRNIQRVFNTFDSLMLRWSAVYVYCQCEGLRGRHWTGYKDAASCSELTQCKAEHGVWAGSWLV